MFVGDGIVQEVGGGMAEVLGVVGFDIGDF